MCPTSQLLLFYTVTFPSCPNCKTKYENMFSEPSSTAIMALSSTPKPLLDPSNMVMGQCPVCYAFGFGNATACVGSISQRSRSGALTASLIQYNRFNSVRSQNLPDASFEMFWGQNSCDTYLYMVPPVGDFDAITA